jgi:hypothetical protein
MTRISNPQPSDDDLELLSAFIDGQLATGERAMLDERLSREPDLHSTLDELRSTVALLHDLEPLAPPRSFALDPAAFAPRPSRLFGWLRLGSTLASVLLALTFAIDFVGSSRGGGAASSPINAPQAASGGAPSQRTAFSTTDSTAEQAPAAPAAAAPTQAAAEPAPAAPAAAEPTAMAAAAEAAAEPTTASAAALAAPSATPEALPSASKAAPPPAAAGAAVDATALPLAADLGVTSAPAAADTTQSGDTSNATTRDVLATAAYPLAGAPIGESGSQSPNTTQLEQPASVPVADAQPMQPAMNPLRLVEISLAALAVLLGLGAVWVRRRTR